MVETKALADGISVSAQIRPRDVPSLAARFRTIVNNRPDGEEAGQPTSTEIEAAARIAGLEYTYIPITPGRLTQEDIVRLNQILSQAPRPILGFCRTGTRSATLWALSQAGNLNVDDILKTAAAAGFDLSALRPRLEERAETA